MVVSIFGIGAVVGGLLSSMLVDKVGRRGGLSYTNIIAFFAALMGLAKTIDVYPMMLFGRFFIGINAGLAVMVPMYLTEIAPINLRGTLGSFHQLFITFSILVSQVFGLPQFFGTVDRWPYIFAFVAVPALLQVIALPMIPGSPKFTLYIRGEVERAIQNSELLRGTGNVWLKVQQMRAGAIRTTNDIPSMLDMFRGSLLWPSTLTVVMMVAQQLTGINAAIFYSTIIFKQTGFKQDSSYATLAVGLINILTTILAAILVSSSSRKLLSVITSMMLRYDETAIAVDHPRFGRRVLLLAGIVGMMISLIFLIVFVSLSKTGSVWPTISQRCSFYCLSCFSPQGQVCYYVGSKRYVSSISLCDSRTLKTAPIENKPFFSLA
ncbi:unnamed protein product [Angiostrongylus costaricensis]|uniref:MFS domain-containing protein n=1 Tax=Angiostrongylus costaricensis TaxID=334426 RepID=A0A0R3Q0B9_ANGCS|nr:unnamed protein product [Angiostrongylus costaricensis]